MAAIAAAAGEVMEHIAGTAFEGGSGMWQAAAALVSSTLVDSEAVSQAISAADTWGEQTGVSLG